MRLGIVIRLSLLSGLIPLFLQAQDVRGKAMPRQLRAMSHNGSSPFDPPQATDHLFVVDTGSGLDTGCSFRSDGPLQITLPINRVVGDVNSDGTLQNPQDLINRNIVSQYAMLVLPAYDVDYYAVLPAPDQPERDHISLNGNEIGPSGSVTYLTGDNNVWVMNVFQIPISMVRFGAHVAGSAPTPGMNQIRVDIDVANIFDGDEDWCTAVDWVYISFDALAPTIMIHGNNSSGAFFDGQISPSESVAPGVTQAFQTNKLLYDNSINMVTDTIAAHSALLSTLIPQKASEFGATWVHLLAHSKGGLDSRDFIASTIPPNFGILSFTTLSTPHHGSPGADYALDAVTANSAFSDNTTRTLLASKVPPDAGTPNLRVSFVEAFNLTNIPLLPTQFTVNGETNPVVYQAVSADANLDGSVDSSGNPTIQIGETRGTGQGGKPNFVWVGVMQQVYNLMGQVASTTLAARTIGVWPLQTTVMVVHETPTPSFRTNDFLVTQFSAQINPFTLLLSTLANHGTITNPTVGAAVVNSIKTIQPIQ
jgi:triacylglycerol lipase